MSALEEKPIPWREMLETLFRRRWTIVAFTVGGFLLASILATLKAPTYTATARIQLTAEGFAGPREEAMDFSQIQAELAYLKSPVLIRSVLRKYQEEASDNTDRSVLSLQRTHQLSEATRQQPVSQIARHAGVRSPRIPCPGPGRQHRGGAGGTVERDRDFLSGQRS